MTACFWAVVPAAGCSHRFGGELPKQYAPVGGRPLIAWTLLALLSHRQVAGAMVALSAQDALWPGWREIRGKPVLTCVGGRTRAASVLAALRALPGHVHSDDFVLIHDAARPNLSHQDLAALIKCGCEDSVGALLATPMRDTLKQVGDDGHVSATLPREQLWRALTPQMFRRLQLIDALSAAMRQGVEATDESMAMEHSGLRPLLVEGREDNFKVTLPADLARFQGVVLSRARALGGGHGGMASVAVQGA